MLQVIFSGYDHDPEAVRISTYPQFGMPSVKIDGKRPRIMRLVGEVNGEMSYERVNDMTWWFINKCFNSMHPFMKQVIIDAKLPNELNQWYLLTKHCTGEEV